MDLQDFNKLLNFPLDNYNLSSFENATEKIADFCNEINQLSSIKVEDKPENKETIERFDNTIVTKYGGVKNYKSLPEDIKKKYLNLYNQIHHQREAKEQDKYIEQIREIFKKADKTKFQTQLYALQKEFQNVERKLNSEYRSKQIVSLTRDLLANKIKVAANYKDEPSRCTGFIILNFLLMCAIIVGLMFYNKYVAEHVIMWLFNNPPYFGHTWQFWGGGLWEYYNTIDTRDFFGLIWKFLSTIIFAVVYLFPLLAEVIWIIVTNIIFAIIWLILTILGGVMYLLFFAIIAAVCVLSFFIYSGISDNYHFYPYHKWMVGVFCVLSVAGTVMAYLFIFLWR